ncbi:MAG: YXWGXW repeat-containing protein [Chitinophagaceae bacterium]
MKNLCLALFIGFAAITFASCSAHVVAERPGQPVFVRPIAPGPGYVWIDGDWYYRGGRYAWHEGYWAQPGTRHWTSGQWVPHRKGYTWRRGRWH